MILPAQSPETSGQKSATKTIKPWLGLSRLEDGLLILILAVMTLLPVAEIVLRALFNSGIAGSVPLVQHAVLAVGMVGGAIAARQNRLLVFSAAKQWFKGWTKWAAQVFSSGFSAAICAVLTSASWHYVKSTRKLGKVLVYGIPVWTIQVLLVLGFAVVTFRLLWYASSDWRGRCSAAALALLLLTFALWNPLDPAGLRGPALVAMGLAALCGAPIFTILAGISLVLFWTAGEPISSVPLKYYQLTVNPTLPSIPLFTLAGYFLAEGKAATRLVTLFGAVFSNIRGGPAIVTALVCAFFTSFTGASGVTVLALGGLLMPVLISARYSERSALGLLTGAGSLGMLFPPCLPPILYAVVVSSGGQVSVSIEQMFKGGFFPGVLLVGLTILWGVRQGPRQDENTVRKPFVFREALLAAWNAKWELLVPVVAMSALFSGYATPVEAAALTAFYTFLVNVIVHRDLNLRKDVPRAMIECGALIGGVLLILGMALGFTYFLIDAQVPDQLVVWVTATIHSKWLFLLGLNIVLVVVGGLVEIYAAIVVVVPLLVPLGLAFEIDPVHLGIIFLANMELGFLAPPIGLNLLLASYRFDKSIGEVTRASLPMLGVMVIGVLLITYVPALTTWLPHVWK